MELKDRIIVALDFDKQSFQHGDVGAMIKQLSPYVGGFKIGMQLGTAIGVPEAVKFVHERGGRVFLDQKFKDIPNTVASAAKEAVALGVWMFNVHADGGSRMMNATMDALVKAEHKPLVLGVTVLTSMDQHDIKEVQGKKADSVPEQVTRLALLAFESGLDGVVASAQEAKQIRELIPDRRFKIITPAIRMEWADWAPVGDQARPTTHIEAIEAGADFVVIGRPLLKAPSPVTAVKRIVYELASIA